MLCYSTFSIFMKVTVRKGTHKETKQRRIDYKVEEITYFKGFLHKWNPLFLQRCTFRQWSEKVSSNIVQTEYKKVQESLDTGTYKETLSS